MRRRAKVNYCNSPVNQLVNCASTLLGLVQLHHHSVTRPPPPPSAAIVHISRLMTRCTAARPGRCRLFTAGKRSLPENYYRCLQYTWSPVKKTRVPDVLHDVQVFVIERYPRAYMHAECETCAVDTREHWVYDDDDDGGGDVGDATLN